jgi:hypothetical protein
MVAKRWLDSHDLYVEFLDLFGDQPQHLASHVRHAPVRPSQPVSIAASRARSYSRQISPRSTYRAMGLACQHGDGAGEMAAKIPPPPGARRDQVIVARSAAKGLRALSPP